MSGTGFARAARAMDMPDRSPVLVDAVREALGADECNDWPARRLACWEGDGLSYPQSFEQDPNVND